MFLPLHVGLPCNSTRVYLGALMVTVLLKLILTMALVVGVAATAVFIAQQYGTEKVVTEIRRFAESDNNKNFFGVSATIHATLFLCS
jgi:flagellar biosynthesis protein FlhB